MPTKTPLKNGINGENGARFIGARFCASATSQKTPLKNGVNGKNGVPSNIHEKMGLMVEMSAKAQ